MNKTLLSAATIAAVGLAVMVPQAEASDGTITFTGAVTASTCTINVNNSGTASATVTLPTVDVSALSAAGNVAAATPFTIALSNCTFGTAGNVGVYFEPGANTQTDGNLRNTDASANNVEIQLLNSTQGVIALNAASGSQNGTTAAVTTATGDGAASMAYYAQYYASAAATPGTVSSSVTYSVVYP